MLSALALPITAYKMGVLSINIIGTLYDKKTVSCMREILYIKVVQYKCFK
jgi:hypothetical protein